MAFKDYSNTPASNTALGDGTFIGPNMARSSVRPALQQLAADGRGLYDVVQSTAAASLAAVSVFNAAQYRFATKADATAGLAGIPVDQFVYVFADETHDGMIAVYRNTAGALVFQNAIAPPAAPNANVVVRPTGMAALPFAAWYGPNKRVQTEYDDPARFRDAMEPDWIGDATKTIRTLYLDADVTGMESGGVTSNNNGDSLLYACADWSRLQGRMIALAADAYVIFVKGRAKAYGNKGPGFGASTAYAYSIRAVPDSSGNRPIFCQSADASLLTWTANATYAWVDETPIAAMVATGLYNATSYVVDVRFRQNVVDENGISHRVPLRYAAVTSLALCAKTPASYWWDAGSSKFYVHAVGGSQAAPDPYEVLILSGIASVHPKIFSTTAATQKQFYIEGCDVIGEFDLTANLDRFAAMDCRSYFSAEDGFACQNVATYTKDCLVYACVYDAFSEANTGGLTNPRTYHLNPTVLSAGTVEGSQQAFSAHSDQQVTLINPVSGNAWRNQITDIQTTMRHVIGGVLGGTRMGAPFDVAGNPNALVQATDSAVVALDQVTFGGFYEDYTLKTQGTAQIRLRNTTAPTGTTTGTVTTTW
jgi:hypothetical protein